MTSPLERRQGAEGLIQLRQNKPPPSSETGKSGTSARDTLPAPSGPDPRSLVAVGRAVHGPMIHEHRLMANGKPSRTQSPHNGSLGGQLFSAKAPVGRQSATSLPRQIGQESEAMRELGEPGRPSGQPGQDGKGAQTAQDECWNGSLIQRDTQTGDHKRGEHGGSHKRNADAGSLAEHEAAMKKGRFSEKHAPDKVAPRCHKSKTKPKYDATEQRAKYMNEVVKYLNDKMVLTRDGLRHDDAMKADFEDSFPEFVQSEGDLKLQRDSRPYVRERSNTAYLKLFEERRRAYEQRVMMEAVPDTHSVSETPTQSRASQSKTSPNARDIALALVGELFKSGSRASPTERLAREALSLLISAIIPSILRFAEESRGTAVLAHGTARDKVFRTACLRSESPRMYLQSRIHPFLETRPIMRRLRKQVLGDKYEFCSDNITNLKLLSDLKQKEQEGGVLLFKILGVPFVSTRSDKDLPAILAEWWLQDGNPGPATFLGFAIRRTSARSWNKHAWRAV